ncbi:MAG: hypothetical protein WAW96_10430 [Alphaproteobacteria bacterium]
MLKRLSDGPPESASRASQPRLPARLSAPWRFAIYAVALGIWLSGIAWLILHYFMMQKGAFGPTPQPAEFWVLAAHAAFAFIAIFIFGALLERHIGRAWPTGHRRSSGLTMAGALLIMIVSGYLLYYLGGEGARQVTSLIHWGLGLLAPIFFLRHRFAQIRQRSDLTSGPSPSGGG